MWLGQESLRAGLKLIEHAVLGLPLTKVLLCISCPTVAPISIDREGSKVSGKL